MPGDPDNSSVLTATSEFGGINLKWTIPNINAHAVAFTKVFRSVSADVNHSVIVGTQNGSSYFDVEPASNPTVTYYYWIQHVSINGSLLEYVGPASARAKPEIDKIIQLLAGRVETSALAQSLRSRIDIITNLESGITSLNNRLESENRLITEALDAVKNDVSGATSYIQSQVELFADEKAAFATAVNTQVSLFSEDVYAAVREETKTRAEETGALFAEKLVKIDLAGNVSGYGLSAYADPDGTSTSDFRVAANRFSIGAPIKEQTTAPQNPYNGMIWVNNSDPMNKVVNYYNASTATWDTKVVKAASPFIVKTTEQNIDGVLIPAGVYINSAVIDRIDATKINTRGLLVRDSDGSVLFGAGNPLDWGNVGGENKPADNATVGMSFTESSNVVTTSNGWSLSKDGSFYAAGGGNRISVSRDAASIQFNKSDGSTAFAVDQTGNALFGGTLMGATGVFSGSLSAGVLDPTSYDSLVYTYTNSGTYTIKVPAKKAGWSSMVMRIYLQGAGGGGGGGASSGNPRYNPVSSGGGGGAGRQRIFTIESGIEPGKSITVIVGAGGSGGAKSTHWISSTGVYASAGNQGGNTYVYINNNGYGADGGSPGGGGTSNSYLNSSNDVVYSVGAGGNLGGQPGQSGRYTRFYGGAGGSSIYGAGGGGGAVGDWYAGDGANGGVGAGGGGGGAESDTHSDYSSAGNGGRGGDGKVIIEFYDPNTVVLNSRYQALISWLDSLNMGTIPAAAR